MPPNPSDRNFFRRSLVVSVLALAPALLAQTANPPGNADSAWQNLLNRALPPSAHAPVRPEPGSAAQQQERRDQLTHFLAIAEEARAFGEAHAGYAKAAQVLEAKNLLKAAFIGDKTGEPRLRILLVQIEGDKSLPARDRFEIVTMAEHLLLRELAKNTVQGRVAREESARYLMKEFPDEAGGYLALLGAADADGTADKIRSVAQEIVDSPAPFAAKSQARILAARQELIGKSLADVANTALGRGNYFEKTRGQTVLLYTWATWSKNSLAYAREVVAKSAPPGVLVIGYNLDRDVAAAKKAALKEGLPGEHYYNEGGPGAWLALLLKLNATPQVYLTDARGVIRDVAAQRGNLTSRLSAVSGR